MKSYSHPKDPPEFLLRRKVGKKRWKVAAVAKLAPHELDTVQEHYVHDQIEEEIKESGLPYLSLREGIYGWLKTQAAKGEGIAVHLIEILKDMPDLTVWAPAAPGSPYSLCLMLELKKGKGGRAKPGQKRLAETTRGTIAKGYTEAHAALQRFLEAVRAVPGTSNGE